jgi:hypothetical protein
MTHTHDKEELKGWIVGRKNKLQFDHQKICVYKPRTIPSFTNCRKDTLNELFISEGMASEVENVRQLWTTRYI